MRFVEGGSNMSIFDDKNLINKLVEAGSDFNIKFAAEPGVLAVDPNVRLFGLAQALGINMQRSLGDPDVQKKSPVITTKSAMPADLTIANMRTLGHFLQWAASNEIQFNGTRIAYTMTDPNRPTSNWIFDSLDSDLTKRDAKGQPIILQMSADKNTLVNYLAYLRDSVLPSIQEPDKLPFEITLKNIIGELNRSLPSTEQQQVRPKSQTVSVDLDPNTVIDAFPDTIMTPDVNGRDNRGLGQAPFFPGFRNRLTIGNLENATALSQWLNSMQIKKPGTGKVVPIFNPEDVDNQDPCGAIRVLYNRALSLSNVARNYLDRQPNYDKVVARYLAAIKEFASTFQDAKGPCQVVTTLVDSSPVAPGTGTGTGPSTTGHQPLSPSQVAALGELVSSMPLHPDYIDLNLIKDFVSRYNSFERSDAGMDVAGQSLQRILLIMGNIQARMTIPFPRINLTQNLNSLQQIVKGGYTDIRVFLNLLEQLVTTCSSVLDTFLSTYSYGLSPEQKSRITQQTQQYTRDNMASISRWVSAAQQVMSQR
jgi:hypothetical protein